MPMFKNDSLRLGFVFMGTVLGAGFASGQEIMRFFCDYGIGGLFGILFSCLLFFMAGFGILIISKREKYTNSRQLLCGIMGKRLGTFFDTAAVIFLFLMLAAMLAGGSEAVYCISGINKRAASAVIGVLLFIVIMASEEGLKGINSAICPLLLIGAAFLSISVIKQSPVGLTLSGDSFKKFALPASFVYVSYNMITALPVMCAAGIGIKNTSQMLKGALTGALGLCVMAVFLYFCLMLNYNRIYSSPLPLLELSSRLGKGFRTVYFLLFLCAVFTTAAGNGFGILKWLEGIGIKGVWAAVIVICPGLILSELGFSELVSKVYPIFGAVGTLELLCIIKNSIRFFYPKRFP